MLVRETLMKLKLLQWNIWYKEDITNIAKLLKEINPDIICLQELTLSHPEHNENIDKLKYLADILGFNHFFKPSHIDPENTFGNVIFSRYPIKENTFHFIKKPEEKIEHFSHQGRVYIECGISINGKMFTVGTVHMSYTDRFSETELKKTETDNLVEILKQKKENFIFTGDLNSTPESYTIVEIEKVLKSCGPDMNKKTWTTKPFSYNGFTAEKLDWRLDYCFSTPDININSTEVIPTKYSDHLPILLEINF